MARMSKTASAGSRTTRSAKRTLASATPSNPKVRVKKELSKEDERFLANMPSEVFGAFNVLVDYGASRVKLCKLIQNRKQPIGRPRNADETARLIYSVERYWQDHPEVKSVKEAIACILESQASFASLSRKQRAEKIRSLEVAYAREIETRRARESESMEEYAARREREMRSNHKTPQKI
jgi:hypothetical protein